MIDPYAQELLNEYGSFIDRVQEHLKSKGWTHRSNHPGQKHVWQKSDGSWASGWYDALVFESGVLKQ